MTINKNILAEIRNIILDAKEKAIRAVDFQRVLMYWSLGKRIFEEEQEGKERADYGIYLIKYLSEQLQPEFGTGFSGRQLERFRQFFRQFPIASALRTQLSWTHYKLLLSIPKEDKRYFYINESEKNNWTARQLERQINSLLFERLLISNDSKSILEVTRNEKQPSDAKEIIKEETVLEFLGLKRESSYYEKDLETAIITHLQDFMLELGNGFSFVGRQKRIHLDGDDFFIDLVFYNRLLRSFVLIDTKTHKLTHGDLGQLQMYVNYYDREIKLPEENKTIGILLCTEKNNAVVKYTLPEDNKNIIASKYSLYLPTEMQLLNEVQKEIESFGKKKE